jgi:hypothetical protein
MRPRSSKGPPGNRTRPSSLPKRRAAGALADRSFVAGRAVGGGGRQSAGRAGLSFPQPPSARPSVAGAGVEPARRRGLSAAALPSLRTRPSRSSRGGNRTRRHQALDLTALPVCVPGHTLAGGDAFVGRISNPSRQWTDWKSVLQGCPANKSRFRVSNLACSGYEPPPGTGPTGEVGMAGFEPAFSCSRRRRVVRYPTSRCRTVAREGVEPPPPGCGPGVIPFHTTSDAVAEAGFEPTFFGL